jgi:hypothetical protein
MRPVSVIPHTWQRRGPRPRDRLEVGDAVRDGHGQVGLRVVHLVEHLVVPVVRIDRHDAAAEGVERQIVKEELRAVLEQQRHAMAVAIAGGSVHVTELQRLGHRPPVAELDALGVIGAAGRGGHRQERVIRRCLGSRREKLEDRAHRGASPT